MHPFEEEEVRESNGPSRVKPKMFEFDEKLKKEKNELYLRLGECSADSLYLLCLAEFQSVEHMDIALSRGRFLTALAKRLT